MVFKMSLQLYIKMKRCLDFFARQSGECLIHPLGEQISAVALATNLNHADADDFGVVLAGAKKPGFVAVVESAYARPADRSVMNLAKRSAEALDASGRITRCRRSRPRLARR